jgi:outer membrane protein assembly factor BamD
MGDKRLIRLLMGCAVASAVIASNAYAQWTWTPQTGRFVNVKRLPKETPELQVEFARGLMVDGKYKDALRETGKFINFYNETDWADDNQYLRGEIKLAQADYADAAKEFQQVVAVYPDSPLFDDVIAMQYEIGGLFFEKGKANLEKKSYFAWRPFRKRPFRRAVDVYNMVIDNQPFTNEAAEAQYKIGLCHFTLEEYVEASYEYQRVVEDYAQSEWADDASYGLAMCYYNASMPPTYDQAPSMLAIEAIDTFGVRYPADARGAELATMREEMIEKIANQRLQTAQFYEKRRRFKSARIYYNVVIDQFPGTSAASEAQTWLTSNPG